MSTEVMTELLPLLTELRPLLRPAGAAVIQPKRR